jgi:type II secretory pathway pseudopilin PulG
MGTQQILLIVLSVIIVGVAIAVGISMFGNQAYNSNQQAVASELQNYGSQCIQYFKTPKSMGGAGKDSSSTVLTKGNISTFIGFDPTAFTISSDNGQYKVTTISGSNVTIAGLGTELKSAKKPLVTTTVTLRSGTITSVVSSGTALP